MNIVLGLYLAAGLGFAVGFVVCALLSGRREREQRTSIPSSHIALGLYGHRANHQWRRRTWGRK